SLLFRNYIHNLTLEILRKYNDEKLIIPFSKTQSLHSEINYKNKLNHMLYFVLFNILIVFVSIFFMGHYQWLILLRTNNNGILRYIIFIFFYGHEQTHWYSSFFFHYNGTIDTLVCISTQFFLLIFHLHRWNATFLEHDELASKLEYYNSGGMTGTCDLVVLTGTCDLIDDYSSMFLKEFFLSIDSTIFVF
ncbi:hypothetical protein ACJX0J_005878, partial [Zea mays]